MKMHPFIIFHKTLSLLFLLSILVGCQKEEEDEISPKSIIYNGWHIAFTSLTTTNNSKRILLAFRQGTDHASYDGKIMQMISEDRGKTWTAPQTIYQPSEGKDARDPQYLYLPNGDLICRFFERRLDNTSSVYLIRSNNNGDSYTQMIPMTYAGDTESYTATQGNMVLINNTIYSVLYNINNETWLIKSTDMGYTWDFVCALNEQVDNDNIKNIQMNETSLCYHKNKMYLVCRRDIFEPLNLLIAESHDFGKTWKNWQELPIKGHAPSLIAHNNYLVMSYRDIEINKNNNYYSFRIILLKDGKIASAPIIIDKSECFDIGYGDIVNLDDQNFIVSYYKEGTSINLYRLNYSLFKK
ncbi:MULTISPECIES: sialidase family protein [Parabacteroides]|jgi:hypothetical protein|uniref:Sialidase domain-containing protein n=1 Tax=Parabacteroides faecis TaxID=1217282 RepID=A0ABR6KTF7_9BACT|nr:MULTISPECIES: sialidase family protein [Parabacteroides]MBB4624088.1 hypothetical protein [Parabacteroides faecis]RHR36278.1 exo-alpha-sialidase [Parabacteroides sp. AF18-52]GGK06511.1 hypothetical protein GCM10007084_32100 [Parabacteroides faecis]